MKEIDITTGFTYSFDGSVERCEKIERIDNVMWVNDFHVSNVKPVKLTDDTFADIGFNYYNGWYTSFGDVGIIMFVKDSGGYVVCVGTCEISGLRIKYIHELQRIILALKRELI